MFPQTKTETKPMSKTNVANLVFALRTKTELKPMTEIKRIGFGRAGSAGIHMPII